jgi:hypothetical protein
VYFYFCFFLSNVGNRSLWLCWIKIAEYQDKGGWGKDGNKCQGKDDHIITGGSPIVTFRWDDTLVDFKNLSIREIQPP